MSCKRALAFLVLSSLTIASSVALAGREPVAAPHAMVVSTSTLASRVGLEILRKGGNAIDAAAAVGLALAVTWPSAGNLGGGGFLLLRRADGKAEVIDYRERAPAAASRDMYLDARGQVVPEASTVGYRAAGVPGTVAGLALAQERHGKLKWADVVRPARVLAEEGFVLDYQTARSLERSAPLLVRFPESKRIFLHSDGKALRMGERLVQKDLGETLLRLEKLGPRELYEGETARRIVADMKAHGGLVSDGDLKGYQPTVRAPLSGSYHGYQVLTMPPPSSGGAILLEMLNLIEALEGLGGDKLATMAPGSSEELHLVVEVMRRAFADRAAYMGDTDFVKVPIAGLTDKKYAATLARTIDREHATPSSAVKAGAPAGAEHLETTHFTIVDGEGNAVSNTYTLNGSFGSGAVAAGTGILLNNEMDDFTSKVGAPNMYGLLQSAANGIAPHKRPLSAMTPTMLLRDGKLFLALGTPGGPTIISSVLQVILGVVDFGMNLQQAIDQPRVHHQWLPDAIMSEPFGINRDTHALLAKMGHVMSDKTMYMGDVNGVMIAPDGARLGACDPRLAGLPVGD